LNEVTGSGISGAFTGWVIWTGGIQGLRLSASRRAVKTLILCLAAAAAR
jgi:hypothetical protein